MIFALLPVALLGAAGSSGVWAQSSNATKSSPTNAAGAKPSAHVAGGYGNWTMLCGKEGTEENAPERCSLVLPLIQKQTQKLVFRVILTHDPDGRLVFRLDGPTGVALQRGVELTVDSGTTYRMPFQTCLPMGCKALTAVKDDLRKDLLTSKTATIVVYALNGRPIQTVAEIDGLPLGLEALDEKRAK